MKTAHDPNEILALVNEKDKFIGTASRAIIHTKGLLHREVVIYIIDDNKVLLQKRQDIGLYDHSCAGHFKYNQSYDKAAIRELYEELGITVKSSELNFLCIEKLKSKRSGFINYRFAKIFFLKKNTDFLKLDQSEVKSAKLFTKSELVKIIKQENRITPSAKIIIEKYILALIK